jgi:hypothetical protein
MIDIFISYLHRIEESCGACAVEKRAEIGDFDCDTAGIAARG